MLDVIYVTTIYNGENPTIAAGKVKASEPVSTIVYVGTDVLSARGIPLDIKAHFDEVITQMWYGGEYIGHVTFEKKQSIIPPSA